MAADLAAGAAGYGKGDDGGGGEWPSTLGKNGGMVEALRAVLGGERGGGGRQRQWRQVGHCKQGEDKVVVEARKADFGCLIQIQGPKIRVLERKKHKCVL